MGLYETWKHQLTCVVDIRADSQVLPLDRYEYGKPKPRDIIVEKLISHFMCCLVTIWVRMGTSCEVVY